jgi:hypothetical protein
MSRSDLIIKAFMADPAKLTTNGICALCQKQVIGVLKVNPSEHAADCPVRHAAIHLTMLRLRSGAGRTTMLN